MRRNITDELIAHVEAFLGKDGLDFFKECLEKHGEVSPVWIDDLGGGLKLPHAVHFREGMQVRNCMRGFEGCKDWGDHDFDNEWVRVVTSVLTKNGVEMPCLKK